MSALEEGWVEVHRSEGERTSREIALVLEAASIPFLREQHNYQSVVLVPIAQADRARREIETFIQENVDWPPKSVELRPPTSGAFAATVYSITIIYGYHLQTLPAFGLDWLNRGMAASSRILGGEWWRTITPLTLHSDSVHLAGNVAFGAIFVASAAQAVGNGVGLLGVFLAGAIGNLLNAIVQSPDHTSIGASTASFGAVGLLVAFQWRRRRGTRWTQLQRWTPPLIGVVLLGYLGTSGERTDVMAHITGFTSGIALGLVASLLPPDVLPSRRVQVGCGVITLLLLIMAWLMAFTSR